MVNNPLHALTRIWPAPLCILCGLPGTGPLAICEQCRSCLVHNPNACRRCALPMPDAEQDTLECGQCQQRPPPFTHTHAPLLYEEHLAFVIQRWKFHRAHWLGSTLARIWLATLPEGFEAVDAIVPMPMHWRRRWQRGYNQSLLLARTIVRHSDTLSTRQLREHCLYRARHTAPQASLSARHRKRALIGAFGTRYRLDGLHVALVDDVMTTGTTAALASEALLKAGASRVTVWAVGRAVRT